MSSNYVAIPTKMDNPTLSGSSRDVDAESSSMAEGAGIPATCSSQQLMPASSETSSSYRQSPTSFGAMTRSHWFTVLVLCFVNMINYMDRFTIAGVLTDIQDDFDIGDDEGGLLQTAFVLSYMVCAPLFGYLGDRYSRRWIMAIGVFLWCTTTLLGSFMQSYGWFLAFRGLVGIGEASYSTIAPTILSDLFIGDMRSKILALFYFAIPVGSGFGYIVGSETAHLANNWRWALRVTPFLGIAAVIFILFTKEPARGESEGSHMTATTYGEDLKYLAKNRSFMLTTIGFTCVAFVTGALAWWGPKFMYLGIRLQPGSEDVTLNSVSYKFGIIAMLAGLFGVPMGSMIAQRLRPRIANCDPYICAAGLMISAPMVYFALVTPQLDTTMCFTFVFIAQVTMNLCWTIVADILLYVVVPTRRSTAEAFQILFSHTFGDAGSPYLVGVFSELIKKHLRSVGTAAGVTRRIGLESLSLINTELLNATSNFNVTNLASSNMTTTLLNATSSALVSPFTVDLDGPQDTIVNQFKALQYSLFSTSFVELLGGVFFLIAAAYIVRDKHRAAQLTLGITEESENRTVRHNPE